MKMILALDEKITKKLRLDPERKFWFGVASVIAHTGDSWSCNLRLHRGYMELIGWHYVNYLLSLKLGESTVGHP